MKSYVTIDYDAEDNIISFMCDTCEWGKVLPPIHQSPLTIAFNVIAGINHVNTEHNGVGKVKI
jgi:hypothetical protein